MQSECLFIRQVPHIQERGLRDVDQLVPVDAFGMIARHVIVRMCIGVVPDDGNVALRKRTVVTTTDRLVPRTIVGRQVQVILLDVMLQPFAKSDIDGRYLS